MPFNGVGVFSGLTPPTYPAVAGEVIDPDYFNAIMADIFGGLTNAITRNGQSTPTANLPMGGFKHTGVADATANDQYATYGQLLAVGGGGGVNTAANFTWTGDHDFVDIADPAILNTEATCVKIMRSSPAGGSGHASPVQSPFVIDHKVNNGTTSFEWSVCVRNSNYDAAGAGDSVAVVGQALKYTTAGKSWGANFVAFDYSGNSGAGILVGIETNVFANGSSGAASRIGQQLTFGKANAGDAQAVIGTGIEFAANGSDKTQAKLSNMIRAGLNVDKAIFKFENAMTAKYMMEFENAGSIDYFLRMKSPGGGQNMLRLSNDGYALGSYVGILRIIVDTYEYGIPIYGYNGAGGPIAM